jgi:hypothetical protein
MRSKYGPLNATTMHHDSKELTLTVINSFNGLLSRMAALDHTGILISFRKILKVSKKQRIEPTMRMSEVIQMTGMLNEDVETFISCRLIAVTEPADDPVLSFRDAFCLVKIFSRFVREGVIL